MNWRVDPRTLPLWVRSARLGFGLGIMAAGFEMVALGVSSSLAADFMQACVLGFLCLLMGGSMGLASAALVQWGMSPLWKWHSDSQRLTSVLSVVGTLLGCWYLWPLGWIKYQQGVIWGALAFAVVPLGAGGVVWFNARYWLQREDFIFAQLGAEWRDGLPTSMRLGWRFWSWVGALGLMLLGAGSLSLREYGSARALGGDPSVLLVTLDTLRRDHLSVYGDSPVQTPVFDGLAKRGVTFDNAVTPFPETGPAHAALFTGRHPVRNGVLSNGHDLAGRYETLAENLSQEGYATAAFVSSIAVDSRTGLDQGFQVYDDDLFPWIGGFAEITWVRFAIRVMMRFGNPTDFSFLLERPAPVTIERALRWLDGVPERPFFMWVHMFEPHSPYESHGGDASNDVDHRWILSNEEQFEYTDPVREQLRHLYAQEVAFTDLQLGTLVAGVEEELQGRPLIIVVVADHGEMLGEHGVEFNHHGIWDDAVQIPLIVVPHDEASKTGRVGAQVRLMDVSATLLALLGLSPMEHSEGGDLMRFVDDDTLVGFPILLMGRKTASLSEGTLLGMRATKAESAGNLKYILDADSGEGMLFDLLSDPEETEDVSGVQTDAVEKLRMRVLSEASEVVSGVPDAGLDAGTAAGLKALGYIE